MWSETPKLKVKTIKKNTNSYLVRTDVVFGNAIILMVG